MVKFFYTKHFLLGCCNSFSPFCAVGRRCWCWMRAHGAGELSASVGRRALVRRLCDAEVYNIREFKSSSSSPSSDLNRRKTANPRNPLPRKLLLSSPASNFRIGGASQVNSGASLFISLLLANMNR